MKQALFIGAFASVLTLNAFADTTSSTVTSKNYVDAADALKQNKIDATGANFTNGSVVETTSTPGVVTQRAIFNPETGLDENEGVVSGHEGDLVTAGLIVPAVGGLYQQISVLHDQMDNFGNYIPQDGFYQQRAMTPPKCAETASNGDCLLWSIGSVIDVFSPNDRKDVCSLDGETCRDASTCCGGGCNPNTHTCYTELM